jgi:hypothetical protein
MLSFTENWYNLSAMTGSLSTYGDKEVISSMLIEEQMWEWFLQADAISLTVCIYAGRYRINFVQKS